MFWSKTQRRMLLRALLVPALALLAVNGWAQREAEVAKETRITSGRVELRSTVAENRFLFLDNVRIESQSLIATCERLEVLASRTGEDPDATIGEIGAIREIIASGNVVITQAGRTAYAGRAVIFPAQGRVLLTGEPRVEDERGVIASGPRMVFVQGERRIIIEGAPESRERPRVILPALPETDFFKDAEEEDVEATTEPEGGES